MTASIEPTMLRMLRRKFGNTTLEVSAISMGCWIFGAGCWGHFSQDDCNRLCGFALDRGITFFDNGDAYGNGRAETLLGSWMKTARIDRSRIEIGGKFGYDWHSDPGETGSPGSDLEPRQDFSPQFMRRALEESLKRLGTDYLDLYLAHDIKLPQFRDDLFAELERVRDEGKIKLWGVSLGPGIGWREEGFKAMGDDDAKAVQTVYNLFEQHPGYELCEMARATRCGILARVQDKVGDASWKTYGPQKIEKIRHIARAHDMTIHQLACKWLLQANPTLTAITATLLTEREIAEACDAVHKSDLTLSELNELRDLYQRDFDLPPEAHPCDLKSSVDPSGKVRSTYVPPPVLIA